MSQQHVVCLGPAERAEVGGLIRRAGASTCGQRRARILLRADRGVAGPRLTEAEVAAAVGVEPRTVARVRARYATHGLAATLARRPRRDRRPPKPAGAQAAQPVALACTDPPAGHARRSLRLLAGRLVELEVVDGISPETVRRALKKTSSGRG